MSANGATKKMEQPFENAVTRKQTNKYLIYSFVSEVNGKMNNQQQPQQVDEIGLFCPYCGKLSNGKIVDTRQTFGGRRRRRICESCGKRFTTIETCPLKFGGLFR